MDKLDNSHIHLGLREKKTKQNPHGWQPVRGIAPDKPCLLALPGSDANTEQKANGFAKLVKSMLKDQSFPVYSVDYEKGNRNFRIDREALLARYGQENPKYPFIRHVSESDKTYIPQYIRELYQMTLAPRLRNENGDKASIATIAQRLNALVLIGQCQGGTVALQLEHLLKEDMSALGLSEKISEYLLKQLHVIEVTPVTPLGVTQATTFKFASFSDEQATSVNTPQTQYILRRKAEHERFMEGLAGNETERQAGNRPFSMDFSVFRPSSTETIFAVNNMYPSSIQQDEEFDGIEHTFDTYSEKEDYVCKGDDFIDRTKQGDQLSTMLRELTNHLVDHAKKNAAELVELPDIFKTPKLSLLIKRAQNNRYNFITKEIQLRRQRQNR